LRVPQRVKVRVGSGLKIGHGHPDRLLAHCALRTGGEAQAQAHAQARAEPGTRSGGFGCGRGTG
jgi:hypothetical protein